MFCGGKGDVIAKEPLKSIEILKRPLVLIYSLRFALSFCLH